MANEKVEVNGKTFEKTYLDDVMEMCKKSEADLYRLSLTFRDLSWFYGLRKEEFDELIKHLNETDRILFEYYKDLSKTKENNNG